MQSPGLSFRSSISTLDANVRIGHTRDALSLSANPSALLRQMDQFGVSRALVLHEYADTMATRQGHEALLASLRDQPRLVPQCCVLPTDDSLKMLAELEGQNSLRSIRLSYDARQKLLLTLDFYGSICRFAQDRRIPLFMPADAVDLRDLPILARAFPDLPLVLVEAHYTLSLWIKPLLRSVPTLHLELSRYEAFDQVNELIAEFGEHRLIYGSAFPRYAMGPILLYLHQCGLDHSKLVAITSANIERLLARGRQP